jgi:AcrR family transcriptional regulator
MHEHEQDCPGEDCPNPDCRIHRTMSITRDMLMVHGYKRTTIEEIARRAGIGKGTVYLHWRTKDELVEDLIQQELAGIFGGLLADTRRDHRACMLHHVIYSIFTTAERYPLFRAFYTGDRETLGRLAGRAGRGEQRYRLSALPPFREYLAALMENQCLRPGLTLEATSDGLDALTAGFFVTEGGSRAGWHGPQIRQRAMTLAMMVRSSFEGPGIPDAQVLRRVSERMQVAFQTYLTPASALTR